ncbi:hypothetical protein [Sphingomonas oleivorans]|uniref:hypothetical protein n=1 Tax=Sphingomonas oleivorans TaxID=1735121 RepID=UPI001A9FDB37|nr:hypothetical protein [Sphingomonas oleivorans]
MASTQAGSETGIRNETYDIVSVLYHALQGAETCQTYCRDASEDQELRRFFEEARDQQQQLAERAKQMLQGRLGGEAGEGGSSAFKFGQGRAEQGGAEQGRAEQGRAEQGGSSSGGMQEGTMQQSGASGDETVTDTPR